jgi:ribosomal protein S27E
MYELICTTNDCPNKGVKYQWDSASAFEVTCSGCSTTYTTTEVKAGK